MRLALLLAVVLLSACRIERNPPRLAQTAAEIARESINRARAQFATAMIKHDAGAVAALFTPGGVLARPLAPDATSPGEIQRRLDTFFRDTTVTWLTFSAERVDLISGGAAFETGAFEETVTTPEHVERTTAGRYAVRWVRTEAVYRIERLLFVPQSVTLDTVPQPDSGG
ncbi:MAG TPA: nuclear transport factor 2 family protein [Longimicrobiales bacterium]|nr:nuclear transport factor 2 family protein [Longimicrobiales bacterium]